MTLSLFLAKVKLQCNGSVQFLCILIVMRRIKIFADRFVMRKNACWVHQAQVVLSLLKDEGKQTM